MPPTTHPETGYYQAKYQITSAASRLYVGSPVVPRTQKGAYV